MAGFQPEPEPQPFYVGFCFVGFCDIVDGDWRRRRCAVDGCSFELQTEFVVGSVCFPLLFLNCGFVWFT